MAGKIRKKGSGMIQKPKCGMMALSAVCFLLILGGCKQSTDHNNAPLSVNAVLLEGQAYLPANVSEWYTYRIQVSDSRYYPDSILCTVQAPIGGTRLPFTLYDDGGVHTLAGPGYGSTTSTDIAAHDGQYTRQINSQLLAGGVTGNYEFHFEFFGNTAYTIDNDGVLAVSIQNAGPCAIASYPHDSAFAECFAPDTLTMHVTPTEGDEPDTVTVSLLQGTEVLSAANFAPAPGDLWQLTLDPTFFRCTGTAQNAYTLRYAVKTRFGMACSTDVVGVSFTNGLPSVSDAALPDTIFRPTSVNDTVRIIMTVRLHDCEYVSTRDYDDYVVKYNVQKQGNPQPDESPAFVMFDDANSPDGHPYDGTFAGGLSITHSDSLLDRLYYFRFYAIDCALPHDTSALLLDSVRLIQPSSGAPAPLSGGKGTVSGAVL